MKKIISLSVALILFFTSFGVSNVYSINENPLLKKKEEEAFREYSDFSSINGSRPCLLRRTNRDIIPFFYQERRRCEELVRIDREQKIARF
jgi:hypothetical protein